GVDALVFLPGVREIERVMRSLEHRLGARAEVLPLHGRLDGAAQDRAVSGGGRGVPRVVVSTDLAESSLTVPGVRLVVDACLSREPRRDTVRDMTGLVTVSASRDSCVQRAGRAARLGPGTALRLLSEDEFSRLSAHRTPAIATSDLTSFALDAACWGAPRGEGLALPDPPPPAGMDRAQAVLEGLGAVDADGRATARGRELARIPADPPPGSRRCSPPIAAPPPGTWSRICGPWTRAAPPTRRRGSATRAASRGWPRPVAIRPGPAGARQDPTTGGPCRSTRPWARSSRSPTPTGSRSGAAHSTRSSPEPAPSCPRVRRCTATSGSRWPRSGARRGAPPARPAR